MGARYFEHKARRACWATHLEAWRRSGVTRTEYCRLHRLTKSTFDRWLSALNSLESVREEARKRRKRTREPVSGDKRNKAVQAFWAMHVEALNWSGMSVRDYATAPLFSPWSLHKWCDRLADGEVEIEWRAHLHPSARPRISTSANDSAKGAPVENILTPPSVSAPSPPAGKLGTAWQMRRSARSRSKTSRPVRRIRRSPARGIVTGALFRWRAERGFGKSKAANLVVVRIADERRNRNGNCDTKSAVSRDILPVLRVRWRSSLMTAGVRATMRSHCFSRR